MYVRKRIKYYKLKQAVHPFMQTFGASVPHERHHRAEADEHTARQAVERPRDARALQLFADARAQARIHRVPTHLDHGERLYENRE